MTVERSISKLELSIDCVPDLRQDAVCHSLSISKAPYWFIDVAFARATAHFVRRMAEAQALLVPSLGFLNHLERWCLVAFLEKLPPDPSSFIFCGDPLWCTPLEIRIRPDIGTHGRSGGNRRS
jgi:hypothetical protein